MKLERIRSTILLLLLNIGEENVILKMWQKYIFRYLRKLHNNKNPEKYKLLVKLKSLTAKFYLFNFHSNAIRHIFRTNIKI